jgi:type I restriction enzyme S subunit
MIEKFCEHFDVISGYAFKSADLKDDGDIPVIKIGNISSGANVVEDSNTQYVSKDFLKINEKYHIKKDDILISLTGSHINQPNSMVGRVCRNYRDRIYLLNQRAGKVILKKIESRDYIFYLLSSKCIKEDIANRAYGAANQVNISSSAIGNIKWDFPSIDMQKKIGDVLSSFDNLIETNNKRIKILEKMAENLYKEWFVRFRFPGDEKAEFVDGVPKDWEITTVGKVAHTLRRGISPTYDDNGSLTVISQKCIRTNIMDITEARKHVKRYNEELNLLDGDTVICSTGTGTLGRVGRIIGDYEKTTFDSHVTLVRAKEGISKLYLYAALKELQPWLVNMGIGSTNQQELYVKTIKRAKVILPEYSLMQNYDKLAYKIDKEIGLLIRMNEKLIKQRDLLLPRLMSGKLQVK